MVNRMGALVRTQWKMEDQVTYGCDIVASFVVRRRSSGGSPEEQPVEITAIINKLFPQAVSVPLKSRITKVATVVKRGDFVGLTPYGSVLYKLESLNSGPETLLEAFPIVVGPTGVSDSVKKETVQAMNMIRAATSGLSAYGIPLDLMMLKKASGIWCPSTYSDPAIIPNVFMRRLLLKTLREVLIDMAVEAATETPGRGPLHEARLCLTKQVNEAKMVSFNTRAARGRISIDTVFVSSNGAVHVQAQFPSEPAPALSVGAATAADQRPPQTSTGALRDSNEDVDAAADTALTSEVTFAIVLAQIWCPSRQFDEVAQEVVSYHQSKRQLSNEFFEKCAAVPNSIRDVIAEAAL
ncbi:hypothetical protein BESB_025190 [Besnoitia besnoiti]|uniref:Uncharacterized protein n=1 Tax=Besnoitia besnoiti TaxID=94643 RepID=A0A2A9M7B7_BESBE|nr:uncharacterized protein BESB_025190 [Besnoitia besnoiti]PFH31553.1 hypothetical protein BESB_025190 [Besnoitia besnoiti]